MCLASKRIHKSFLLIMAVPSHTAKSIKFAHSLLWTNISLYSFLLLCDPLSQQLSGIFLGILSHVSTASCAGSLETQHIPQDTVFPPVIAVGNYFFLSHKKGRLFEGDVYFKPCSLRKSCPLNILFYFPIKSKNNHVK